MGEVLFAPVVENIKVVLREITHWPSVVIEDYNIELHQPGGGANDGSLAVLRL
jgi:hypothetical protein